MSVLNDKRSASVTAVSVREVAFMAAVVWVVWVEYVFLLKCEKVIIPGKMKFIY